MEEKLYLIKHLTLLTGLTDRTIRAHIANGFLKGERINGIWHFTPEQVEAFLRHPSVRPGIQAKRNAIVYDFMAETDKPENQACLILDLPGHEKKQVGSFFSYYISTGNYQNKQFSYDHISGVPRVILRGNYQDIHDMVDAYYAQRTH